MKISLRVAMAVTMAVVAVVVAVIAFVPTYVVGVNSVRGTVQDLRRTLVARATEGIDNFFRAPTTTAFEINWMSRNNALNTTDKMRLLRVAMRMAIRSTSTKNVGFMFTDPPGDIAAADARGRSTYGLIVGYMGFAGNASVGFGAVPGMRVDGFNETTETIDPSMPIPLARFQPNYGAFLPVSGSSRHLLTVPHREVSWTPPLVGTNSWQLNLVARLYDAAGRQNGYFQQAVQPDPLNVFLRGVGLRSGGSAAVFDVARQLLLANSWGGPVQVNLANFTVFTAPEEQRLLYFTLGNVTDPLFRRVAALLGETTALTRPAPLSVDQNHDGETVFVDVADVRDDNGLHLRLIIAIPERDFLGDVASQRGKTVGGVVGAVVVVMLLGVGLVVVATGPLRVIALQMVKTANLVDDGSPVVQSIIAEVHDVAESYARIRTQLAEVKQYVPHALLEQLHGNSGAPSVAGTSLVVGEDPAANNVLLPSHGQAADAEEASQGIAVADPAFPEEQAPNQPSLRRRGSSSDLHVKPMAAWGINAKKLAGSARNTFVMKRCTLLYLETPDLPTGNPDDTAKDVAPLMEIVVDAALKNGGVMESLTPEAILVSFNAHSMCHMHEDRAMRMALMIRDQLSPLACIALDTGLCCVGNVSACQRSAQVVVGEPVDLVRRLPSLMRSFLHTQILLTDRCARGVFCTPVISVDRVGPSWAQKDRMAEVVVCEVTDASSENENENENEGENEEGHAAVITERGAFKKAFGLLCCGRAEDAAATLKAFLGNAKHGNPPLISERFQRVMAACDAMKAPRLDAALGAHEDARPYCRREVVGWSAMGQNPTAPRIAMKSNAAKEGTTAKEPRQLSPSAGALDQLRIHASATHELLDAGGLFDMAPSENDSTPPVAQTVAASATRHAGSDSVAVQDTGGTVWLRSKLPVAMGGNGKVYQALGPSGTLVALKAIDMYTRNFDAEQVVLEVALCSRLRHSNIAAYIACAVTTEECSIIMEYVPGGSLKALLVNFGVLPTAVVKRFAAEILQGLQYLHSNRVVHCDIKPHNVLLGMDGTVKLVDFGSSIVVATHANRRPGTSISAPGDPVTPVLGEPHNSAGVQALASGANHPSAFSETMVLPGTAWYMAPEVARGEQPTPASDIFSFGITVLELMTGVLPWPAHLHLGNESQFIRALGWNDTYVPVIPPHFPRELQGTLKRCLSRDAAMRPTPSDLLAASAFGV